MAVCRFDVLVPFGICEEMWNVMAVLYFLTSDRERASSVRSRTRISKLKTRQKLGAMPAPFNP